MFWSQISNKVVKWYKFWSNTYTINPNSECIKGVAWKIASNINKTKSLLDVIFENLCKWFSMFLNVSKCDWLTDIFIFCLNHTYLCSYPKSKDAIASKNIYFWVVGLELPSETFCRFIQNINNNMHKLWCYHNNDMKDRNKSQWKWCT